MLIRPATLADSDSIADILADGWTRAYSGFLPQSVLAPRADRIERRREIRAFLETDFDPTTEILYVSEIDDAVVGFVHAMLGDKAGLGTGGHVPLLYVDKAASGKGVGRALLRHSAHWLNRHTGGSIAIAAFSDNPFHPFYARVAGVPVKSVEVKVDDFACRSIVYLWDDAATLARGCS